MAVSPGRDDFASASLVALVVKVVAEADPDILPRDTATPDPMRAATLPAADKRDLLDHIYRLRGAGLLLTIGCHLDSAASPLLAVLANAERPDILIDKWMRLERYGHAVNRTDIRLDGERALECRRYAAGASPTPAENALIAGFLFGLCGLAGARRRLLRIEGHTLGRAALASVGAFSGAGAAFRIEWQSRDPLCKPGKPISSAQTASEQLKALLAGDAARSWSLAEAARSMAKSTRSLQRELAATGRSFSGILRGVRVDEAAQLIRGGGVSLAEIGYCCGYADQPHFQRDFRRALNMSPGEYRALSHCQG